MEITQDKSSQPLPIELVLAKLLRVGSVIAAVLMALGILSTFGLPVPHGSDMITWGILVLLATPIMRVAVAALVFLREKDWRFALFCGVVLCFLALGVILGGHTE